MLLWHEELSEEDIELDVIHFFFYSGAAMISLGFVTNEFSFESNEVILGYRQLKEIISCTATFMMQKITLAGIGFVVMERY